MYLVFSDHYNSLAPGHMSKTSYMVNNTTQICSVINRE